MEQVAAQESQGNSGNSGKTGKTYYALDGRNTLEAVRKRHIEVVLEATEHDLGEAAWILQVSVPELRRLITRLEVPWESRKSASPGVAVLSNVNSASK